MSERPSVTEDPWQGAVPVDAIDLRCPLPVLKAQTVLRALPAGATVALVANDPMAKVDVPHFCTEGGHTLVEQRFDGERSSFLIRKRA